MVLISVRATIDAVVVSVAIFNGGDCIGSFCSDFEVTPIYFLVTSSDIVFFCGDSVNITL